MFCNILKIKSLKLNGFMGAGGELIIPFNDEYVSEFIGDNGKGKTLILNAISFVFCGTDAFGNKENFSSKLLGSESLISVECVFDSDFKETTLKRMIKTSAKGRTTTSLYKDLMEVGVVEWEKSCDRDIFLSMINPKYLSSLSTTEIRKVLLKFLKIKNIDYNEIFNILMYELEDKFLDDFMDWRFLFYEKIMEVGDNAFNVFFDECKNSFKEVKTKIKELKDSYTLIENQKPIDDIHPEYIIGSDIYEDEEEAFNSLIEKINKDNSKSNIDNLKLFNEQKSQKAIVHNTFLNYKNDLLKAKSLREKVESLEGEQKVNENYIKFFDELDEYMLKEMNSQLESTNIKLQFKNIYDKKEFNIMNGDIPLSSCSYSEQINSALTLSDCLMNFLELNYPIVIDNAECITSLPELKGFHQIISLQVAVGYELSLYKKEYIEELKTSKALPTVDKASLIKTHVVGSHFEVFE